MENAFLQCDRLSTAIIGVVFSVAVFCCKSREVAVSEVVRPVTSCLMSMTTVQSSSIGPVLKLLSVFP